MVRFDHLVIEHVHFMVNSHHASMAELLENGALGIISKPYRRLELGQAITKALDIG